MSEYAICTVGIRGQVTTTVGTHKEPLDADQAEEWGTNQRSELVRMGCMPVFTQWGDKRIWSPELMALYDRWDEEDGIE